MVGYTVYLLGSSYVKSVRWSIIFLSHRIKIEQQMQK